MVLGYHNFSNNFTCHWHLEFKIPLSNWLTDHSSFGLDWICHDVTNRLTSLQQWWALNFFLLKSFSSVIKLIHWILSTIWLTGMIVFVHSPKKLMHIATNGSRRLCYWTYLLNFFNAVGRVMCHSSLCVPWGKMSLIEKHWWFGWCLWVKELLDGGFAGLTLVNRGTRICCLWYGSRH